MKARVQAALGVVFLHLDRAAEAEAPLRGALERTQRFFGPLHDQVIMPAGNLAQTLQVLGRPSEARPFRELEVSILEREHGPTSPFLAGSLCQLAILLFDEGSFGEASAELERLLFALEAGPSVAHGIIARKALVVLLEDDALNLRSLAEPWKTFDRLWIDLPGSQGYPHQETRELLLKARKASIEEGMTDRAENLESQLAAWDRDHGS